jgi:two-component system NtrC family sensor kinase
MSDIPYPFDHALGWMQSHLFLVDRNLNLLWSNRPIPDTGRSTCYISHCSLKAIPEACPALRALETGEPTFGEVEVIGPNGMRSRCQVSCIPIRDPEGRVVQVLEEVRASDLVQEAFQQTLAALQASEERYRASLDQAPDAILAVDPEDLSILDANRRAVELTGYTKEDLLEMKVYQLHVRSDKPQVCNLCATLGRTEQPYEAELTFLRKDGSELPIHVSAAVIRYGEKRFIQRICRDLSEKKRMEAQIRQAEKLAALGELASGVAHEINNPLTAVMGFSEILKGRGDLPGEVREKMGIIFEQADRARHIVQHLLSFARQRPPSREAMDLNAVVDEVVEMSRYTLEVRNIRVLTDLDPAHPTILGDPHQLKQVLMNLVLNAEQAILGARGEGTMTIKTAAEGSEAILSVWDDGPGIAPEHLEKIFDPFFTTKPVGQGTGLGLSVAYGIVTGHHGRIAVHSKPGEGATFVITLPSASQEALRQTAFPAMPASWERSLALLIVDDDRVVGEVAALLSRELGHRAEVVYDGEEALRKLQGGRYDALIVDLVMPGMSGMELSRRIRLAYPRYAGRMLFITGAIASQDIQVFLAQPGIVSLNKPFTREAFAAALARLFPTEATAGD